MQYLNGPIITCCKEEYSAADALNDALSNAKATFARLSPEPSPMPQDRQVGKYWSAS